MNILYVSNSGKIGGMEKHLLDLVSGMSSKGHKVFVWCPEGEMSGVYTQAGAKVLNRKINYEVDLKYVWELYRFIKVNKIDVLHAHEIKAVSHALIAGFLSKVKVKITHTHTPISTWKINKLKRLINIKIYSLLINFFSDKEISLTRSVLAIKQKEGIKTDKLLVIPNAIEISQLTTSYNERMLYREEIRKRYSIPQNDFVFGCVGRTTQEKGHEVLIKAFKKFLDPEIFHKRNFYLIIAGGGSLEQELKKLANELSISEKVIITGVFKEEDKVKFYSAFDVFIFPSYAEGFGLSLAEAMYFSIPTICSDLDILKDVGGNFVSYFKTGSSDELAEKMTLIYKDIVSNKDLDTEKARMKVESEYTLDIFTNNYLTLYKSLL